MLLEGFSYEMLRDTDPLDECAVLLLPLPAAPESQLQVGTTHRTVASAHVDFKIVIPAALSLELLEDTALRAGAQRVAIGGNGRTVALAATLQGSEGARRDVILDSRTRKAEAQDMPCALGGARRDSRLICTVSMP